MRKAKMSIEDALSNYIVTASGCWEWQGYIDRNGYGKVYDKKQLSWVHRVAYSHYVGQIPARHEVHHLCGNTICMNPDHLEAVTKAEHAFRHVQMNGGLLRQKEAAHLRESGMTFSEIAEFFGLQSRTSGQDLIRRGIANGVVDPDSVPRVDHLSESQREDIRDMYSLGVPQTIIGRFYRIDSSTASRICSGRKSARSGITERPVA